MDIRSWTVASLQIRVVCGGSMWLTLKNNTTPPTDLGCAATCSTTLWSPWIRLLCEAVFRVSLCYWAYLLDIFLNPIIFAFKSILVNMADLNRIKIVLVEQKKTSKWLAERLGKNPSTVSKWCTNTSQPDLATLRQIAILLDIDVKELITSSKK